MESVNRVNQIEIKKPKVKSDKIFRKALTTSGVSNNDMLIFDVDKLNQFK